METSFFVKKDIKLFLAPLVVLVVILTVVFIYDVKYHFVDNIAEKLYNIVLN